MPSKEHPNPNSSDTRTESGVGHANFCARIVPTIILLDQTKLVLDVPLSIEQSRKMKTRESGVLDEVTYVYLYLSKSTKS